LLGDSSNCVDHLIEMHPMRGFDQNEIAAPQARAEAFHRSSIALQTLDLAVAARPPGFIRDKARPVADGEHPIGNLGGPLADDPVPFHLAAAKIEHGAERRY